MIRTFDLLMVGLLACSVAWTFHVKSDSREALSCVERLKREILAEREAIRLLRADWAVLSSPGRLQKLVEQYAEELQLRPVEISQIAGIEDIPLAERAREGEANESFEVSFEAFGNPERITKNKEEEINLDPCSELDGNGSS